VISRSISGVTSGRAWQSRKTARRLRLHGDLKVRGFTDPVFLVPSPFFHKHALHGIDEHGIKFQFHASMEQGSKDV
jgi:hypothetical protein